ncbi:hypothetical protein SAMN05216251_13036 [Actinacidiphila alni]|uniref:Uncharacterized protein n=1 Tax=Actinacidiphila alni TaxID=380248 RepID=A0A1I2LWC5_9ACTN|nr:hypothetical protein [Actinacidiphila alni]SFF81281.1 hypothetical protein SAMN05216251_13036 [Actinacidiphila alni]
MGGVNASHGLNTLVPLASGELNQDKVTPGLLGFVIFAAIAIGLWLLMKNMGKQMKRIDFVEEPEKAPARAEDERAPAPAPKEDVAP